MASPGIGEWWGDAHSFYKVYSSYLKYFQRHERILIFHLIKKTAPHIYTFIKKNHINNNKKSKNK